MKRVYFAGYKEYVGDFFETKSGPILWIHPSGLERDIVSILLRVYLRRCVILQKNKNRLLFKYDFRIYDFQFYDYVAGLEKVKITLSFSFFRKLPIYIYHGEIGSKFKDEFLDIFGPPVNNCLQYDGSPPVRRH